MARQAGWRGVAASKLRLLGQGSSQYPSLSLPAATPCSLPPTYAASFPLLQPSSHLHNPPPTYTPLPPVQPPSLPPPPSPPPPQYKRASPPPTHAPSLPPGSPEPASAAAAPPHPGSPARTRPALPAQRPQAGPPPPPLLPHRPPPRRPRPQRGVTRAAAEARACCRRCHGGSGSPRSRCPRPVGCWCAPPLGTAGRCLHVV